VKKLSETEKILEILSNFADRLEGISFQFKREIAEIAAPKQEKPVATVLEQTFTTLAYETHTGEKLADYETATEKNNIPDKFRSAYNILRQANATISSRYHGENYVFSYWLFKDKIYRQKLRK
jgi:hypothetical protein